MNESTNSMQPARTLRQIVRNMITLYINRQFEDLLIYQQALNHGLNRFDLAAVKQSFRHKLNNRG